jgi:hypothetical protein
MVADHDERDIMFLRQSRQADRNRARQCRGTVEHHQAECAAAQQDVGTPGAPVSAGRADHPEAPALTGFRPLAGGQRA